MTKIKTIRSYYEGLVEPIYRAALGTALHLAMFEGDEPRATAQKRTKEFLVARLPPVSARTTILDLGSGYGDMARFLAQRFDCRVVGLNLVHSQNLRAVALNREANLAGQISTIEADFAQVPLPSACAEIVWSQESLLHAKDRPGVLQEVARLLQPGGTLMLTDILQIAPMEPEEARLLFARVKIDSLESFDSYKEHLRAAGLTIEEVVDLSRFVAGSYADLANSMRQQYETLAGVVGTEYMDYTIQAIGRWVNAAQEGKLGWGLFVAKRGPMENE